MTLQELQVKYEESTKKVEKRLNLTKKAIANDEHNLDGILEDFYKAITNTKGEIVGGKLMDLNIKYFPENPHRWVNEGDVMENLCKLEELMVTNFNWKVKVNKAINEENEEKVEAIWNFLQNWRAMAREWFIKRANQYMDLKVNYDNAWAQYKTTEEYAKKVEDYAKRDAGYRRYRKPEEMVEIDFNKNYYGVIDNLVYDIAKVWYTTKSYFDKEKTWHKEINEELLDKRLDADVKAKYKDLVNRITAVVGTIKDAKYLHIDANGNLNGIVIGEDGKAKVETIGAGGWNIMVFHYRTLVHKIK